MELKVQSAPSNLPKLSVQRTTLPQQKLTVQPPSAVLQQPLSVSNAPQQQQQITAIGTADGNMRPYTPRMDLRQFGQMIKQKYPQYASVDDEELGVRTLERYPEYADRVQTAVTGQPQQQEQDRSGGFFSRLGGDIKQRVSNLRESSQLVDEGKQGNVGFGFQTAGQLAGLIGDVATEGVTSAWRTLAPKSAQEGLAKRGEELAGSGAAQSLMGKYQGFKEAHPVAAKNVEAGLNIASLLPVGKGASLAARPVGEAAGVAATQVEKQIAKKALEEALILIEPQLTKKTATTALKKGLGKITRTGALALEASPADYRIANAIKDFVDISKSIPDNITSLKTGIAEISDKVIQGLREHPAIFNENQMRSFLDKTKESSRVIFGTDAALNNQYDSVIDLYMEQLGKQKNVLEGALEARKQFDNIIEQKFPNLYNNPASDVVRVNAIKDVRRAVNDFIANKLPEGNEFKSALKQQSEMFTAIDRMAVKQYAAANKELLDQVSSVFKRHPIATAAGLVGIGTTLSLSNPIVLASILLYGSYKVGKKVITMRNLAKILRTTQKVLNPQEKKAINAILRAMRNSIGLTTEDVSSQGFQNFTDLSLKTLARLEGKTTVSKQFIEDLTKMGDIKQIEREIITDTLNTFDGDTVSVPEFAARVKEELLPLSAKDVGSPHEKLATLNLPERGPIEKYSEKIYESPIETSAGYEHYNRSKKDSLKYFAHSRYEDVPKDTRRIVEIQSDLFQKDRLEKSVEPPKIRSSSLKSIEKAENKFEKDIKKLSPYRNLWSDRLVREEVKQAALDGKTKLQFPTGETAMKIEKLGSTDNWAIGYSQDLDAPPLTKEALGSLSTGDEIFVRGIDDTYRVISVDPERGTFKSIIDSDVENMLFDHDFDDIISPDDADYFADHLDEFFDSAVSDPKVMKRLEELSEQYDVSGAVDKSNPIYRFYEKEVGRYLRNKYNARLVTDDQGVTWWELDVPKDTGRKPIEAYAAAPLTLKAIRQNNQQE